MANLYDKASFILTANAYSSSKLFSIKPTDGTGDLTFTRASSGSRINSNGVLEFVNNNIPRLTYSGSSCPQFLFEPTRINYILQSNNFSGSFGWVTASLSLTASQTNELTGLNDATRLNAFGASNNLQRFISTTISSGSRITNTVFFKNSLNNPTPTLSIVISDGFNGSGIINFTVNNASMPVFLSSASSGDLSQPFCRPTYDIIPAGNSWYRIATSFTLTTASTPSVITQFNPLAGGVRISSSTSCFVYGAQLEVGNYPTSYIPTTTATVTRAADASGGTGFAGPNMSSSIGQSEGTIYYEFTPAQTMVGSDGRILTVLTPNTNQISGSVGIALNGNDQFQFFTYSASSAVLFNAVITNSPSPVTASQNYKIALAYSSSNSKAYINGSQVYSNTTTWPLNGITGSQGPMNKIWLSNVNYFSPDNGKEFKTVAIYKTRLSDSELIALTT
jgi:hypothetical protein